VPVSVARSRSNNALGRETRLLLMRSAERLFAEHGVDVVSLREISAAAGLRMAGAVGYYFGDKDGLIRAIIEDRDAQIDRRRRSLLEDLQHQGRVDDLRAVAEVGLRPSIEAIGETGYYFRFLSQLDRHPRALSDAWASGAFKSALHVLDLQLNLGRDHLAPMLLEQRKQFGIHLVIAALADLEAQTRGPVDEVVASNLIDCLVALYSVNPSVQTLTAYASATSGTQRTRQRRTRQ
jgi:AcrR family transcriptional regulator